MPMTAFNARLWVACLCLMLAAGLFVATTARAQIVERDYYTSRDPELLNNLNRYHVLPAEQKISKHLYAYARADIDFILRYYPNHPQALLLLVQLCNEPGQRCDLDLI